MSRRTPTKRSDDEVLREVLDVQGALIAALRVGYGDPKCRDQIEKLRLRLTELEKQYPEVYAHAEELRKSEQS